MMLSDQEVKNKLVRTNNNMDAVRYVLAFIVVMSHYNDLTGSSMPMLITVDVAVAAFFTLSGFLVFDSYYRRRDLWKYISARARRILPPYILIVAVCAVGMAGVSSLSVAEYFGSWQWWKYLIANISFLNFIEPSLPGVFNEPQMLESAVNGSLWTMKVEWFLYFSVPVVAWVIYKLHRYKHARTGVILSVIILSILYRAAFIYISESTGRQIFDVLSRQFFGQLSYFYVGVLIRLYLKQFLSRSTLMAVLIALGWGTILLVPATYIYLGPFVYSGLVLWVSLVGRWGVHFSRHDNVSYDIYLFHFPIIQLAVLWGIDSWSPVVGLATVTVITFIVGLLSWNLVGRRFQQRFASAA